MDITEVRIKLVESGRAKLKAYCSITIENCFVIRDLKIIEGSKGLFVAMPSRKLTIRCKKCAGKNQLRSNFCSECGYALPEDRGARGRDGRVKFHADIAHPISTECREAIQAKVLASYEGEREAASRPGYRALDFDDYGDGSEGGERIEEEDGISSEATNRAHPVGGTTGGGGAAAPHGTRRAREPIRAAEREPEPGRARASSVPEGTRARQSPRESRAIQDSPPDDNFGAGLF